MRRFRFDLEQVLELRRWSEREKELELGRLVGECLRLQQGADQREQQARSIFLERGDGFNLERLALIEAYGARMREEKQQMLRELGEREEERESARQDFLRASRDRKVLEKLKERKAQEYNKRLMALEQRELDEIGSNRAARKLNIPASEDPEE